MDIILLLSQHHKKLLITVILLSIATAGLGIGIIAFIDEYLIPGAADAAFTLYAQFFALILLLFVFGTASHVAVTMLGHKLVYRMRLTLIKRILDTKVEHLESLGTAKLLASLNSDTASITSAFIALPAVIYGLTLSIAGFFYLAWLALPLFLVILGWLSLIIFAAWFLLKRTHREIGFAREAEDALYQDYQAILDGRKELRLNRDRARKFYNEEFSRDAGRNRDHDIRADIYNGINDNWVNAMILGSIGLVFLLAHGTSWASASVAITFALTILFLRTPLSNLVMAVPALAAGNVALSKLKSLDLAEYRREFTEHGTAALPADWKTLSLEGIHYQYQADKGDAGFSIGPLDLDIRRGETIFIIGGNGSGKSTLVRILVGLYDAHAGQMRVENRIIDEALLPAFHRLFSTVFSDFYLFTTLLGPEGKSLPAKEIDIWLTALAMAGVAKADAGRLTNTQLSQGQRKRLALLVAILEKRPILVLDEWAADQDPQFRRVFYTTLLPELKNRGITIIAITHDDHYFHVADRILKMDNGQLQELHRDHHSRPPLSVVDYC